MRATLNLKKLVLVGGASAFALLAAPLVSDYVTSGLSPIVATVQAAESHTDGGHAEGGHSGGSGKKGPAYKGGQAGGSGAHGGSKSTEQLISPAVAEDSDRPAWAGGKKELNPHRGDGNAGSNTMKGGDYGDIYVLLRNDDGTPVTQDGEFFVCLTADCTVTVKTVEGGSLPEDPAAYPVGYSAANAIPVEFGRMNVARAPSSVLTHSLDEALAKISGDTLNTDLVVQIFDGVAKYWDATSTSWVPVPSTTTVYTDPMGRLVYYDGTNWLTIDSPLENLALYQAILEAAVDDSGTPVVGDVTVTETVTGEGGTTTLTFTLPSTEVLEVAASLIAGASDKTGDLSVDEIMNISKFLGVDDDLSKLVGDYVYTPTYDGTLVNVLVSTGATTFELQNVDLGTLTYNVIPTVANTSDGIDAFAQEADDNVTIFEFVHDNSP